MTFVTGKVSFLFCVTCILASLSRHWEEVHGSGCFWFNLSNKLSLNKLKLNLSLNFGLFVKVLKFN